MNEREPSMWPAALRAGGLAFTLALGALAWRAYSQQGGAGLDSALGWAAAVGAAAFLGAAWWFGREARHSTQQISQSTLRAVVSRGGWIHCPRCGVTFSLGDRNVWRNGQHLSCGADLDLVREEA